MTASSFNKDYDPQTAVIIELLDRTKGVGFAVLSHKHTAAIQQQLKANEGILRRPNSGEGIKISHNSARLKSFSKHEFLNDAKIRRLILDAFITGHLGVKTAQKHYAFNQERSREFNQANIKTIVVTNNPPGEHEDAEGSLDTISDEVYLQLLKRLNQITEALPEVQSEKTENEIDTSDQQKGTLKPTLERRRAFTPNQSPKERIKSREGQEANEVIAEHSRAEDRERVKSSEKKDRIASEKLRNYISAERLKAEIKNSSQVQSLITNGEVEEQALFDLLERAEITEGALFKLLEIAEIDKSLFLEIFKDAAINETRFKNLIKNLQ